MEISAHMVKELREKTGAGMMECKKALAESKGNIDQAIEYLRKKGLQASAKKEGRIAADGSIFSLVSPDAKIGVLLELNCETDFVAKNEDFMALGNELISLLSLSNLKTIEELGNQKLKSGKLVTDKINEIVAKIGEKISLRRFEKIVAASDEIVGNYIHMGSKIGVLVKMKGTKEYTQVVRDVAMHIAASVPRYLEKEEIPASVIASEKEIYREQLKTSGKPEAILEKILEGKMSKFSTEVCLLDQVFIKDPTGKKSVSQILKETNLGLVIMGFLRYQVGEGIEKKKEDFASEVAKMVG
ncbi:MAG: translation elongation factor Ts [Deltaproteobacteria bacterium RIFCSPLOWO2_12_FULL_40_28]|nr:MAG: translation elongation factor Ts [Deltaproteobacteria bacterium RIFCSPHIGHO2_02_FULL_40_28]OGQ18963.1 MAG: translation elongation factor Ts [Deltaproteobacteria bacterium RIFCSPHIGHO2_12_FULL_40_32]OGQ39506.1 MAG: translation elongation factor Ts [Deltaproteobacteria bacterium RIFCSPLOWO2_02_FULL_40_36]OGQ53396.1 MAG: translation elongation factor Ts [Deltaproteobacteria bacterium RIFCSPLOWO2_12_FULL_40_28]